MEITQEKLTRYFHAIDQRGLFGRYVALNDFKNDNPEEYQFLMSMSNKRREIKDNALFMMSYSDKVCFGALTFDDSHDSSSESNKRKQAIRHLNEYMNCWLLVEEYGDENGRYHCHFIGVLKNGIKYSEFNSSWHSFAFIEKVKSRRKTAKYLCEYTSKQVPRLRRSKSLITCMKHYVKARKWNYLGFDSLAHEHIQELNRLTDDWNDLPF